MYFSDDEADRERPDVARSGATALDAAAFEDFGSLEPVAAAPKPAPIKTAFSWVGLLGGAAALAWVGGAAGLALSYFGSSVLKLDPRAQLGLVVMAVAPALLFWLAASAAAEALKARRLAVELTRMVRLSHAPFEASTHQAGAVSHAIREEIASLSTAVTDAMQRLAQLEASTRASASAFSDVIAASRRDAEALSETVSRERAALTALHGDLKGQTEQIAESVNRQIRLMRETSKLVTSEMSAAEDALDSGLAAFAVTADSVSAHASAMKGAAQEAANATARLDGTMGRMLHGLAEATRLSEAARQSSEEAVNAAKATAGAVRDSTLGAIEEANRAMQAARTESAAMKAAANDTLTLLRDTAATARAKAETSTAAIKAPRTMDIYAAAAAARATHRERPVATVVKADSPWRLPPTSRLPQPANERAPAPIAFDAELKTRALDLVANCGVDLDRALSSRDLNEIATSSQKGAAARRRAVLAAAPGAVGRITRRIKGSDDAQAVANEFRARPHLAKSDRKGEDSDLVRAYLLIDAALAS